MESIYEQYGTCIHERYTVPYIVRTKNMYLYRVSIRIVDVSYNGSYTKHFFTGHCAAIHYANTTQ